MRPPWEFKDAHLKGPEAPNREFRQRWPTDSCIVFVSNKMSVTPKVRHVH